MRMKPGFLLAVVGLLGGPATWVHLRYLVGKRDAARVYDASGRPRDDGIGLDPGSVHFLSVLPLVDWYASSADLGTEAGVSYLLQADETTILFDLGLGGKWNGEPILLHNMAVLGVDPSTIDLAVISHPHGDHIGGTANKIHRVAGIRGVPDLLAGKPVYSTVPLLTGGRPSIVVDGPQVLARGVASTGPLPVQLYGAGHTEEQALAVNVAGRGLVIILGCGHPGVQALVERAQQMLQQPVYAVIGGMHLPVTDDRVRLGPIRMQRLMASTDPPWRPAGPEVTYRVIHYLQETGISLVSPSAHDSCDWSLQAFAEAFGDRYRPLLVGDAIHLESPVAGNQQAPATGEFAGGHSHV